MHVHRSGGGGGIFTPSSLGVKYVISVEDFIQ